MNKKEYSELCHNVNNPLAIINGIVKVKALKEEMSKEDAKLIEEQIMRIASYLKEIKVED